MTEERTLRTIIDLELHGQKVIDDFKRIDQSVEKVDKRINSLSFDTAFAGVGKGLGELGLLGEETARRIDYLDSQFDELGEKVSERLRPTSLTNLADAGNDAAKSIGRTNDSIEDLISSMRNVHADGLKEIVAEAEKAEKQLQRLQRLDELQTRSDQATRDFGVFGDIDTQIGTLGGSAQVLGLISKDQEQTFIKVKEAFAAVEAGGRLVADSQLAYQRVLMAVTNASKGQILAMGAVGVAVAGLVVAGELLGKMADENTKKFNRFKETLSNVTVESLDILELAVDAQAEDLQQQANIQEQQLERLKQDRADIEAEIKRIDDEQEIHKLSRTGARNRGREIFDDLGNLIGLPDWHLDTDELNDELESVNENIRIAEENLAKLDDEYLRNAVLTNEAIARAKTAGQEYLAYMDLSDQMQAGNVDALKAYAEEQQRIANASRLSIQSLEADRDALIASSGPSDQIDKLNQQIEVYWSVFADADEQVQIATTRLIPFAEVRRDEIAAINDAAEAEKERIRAIESTRDALLSTNDEIARLQQNRLLTEGRRLEDEALKEKRAAELAELDAEELRLREKDANEKQAKALSKIEEDGNAQRLALVTKQQNSLLELDKNFMKSGIEAQRTFAASMEKSELEHRRRLRDIARDAQRSMEDAELNNDVVAFIAAQTQQRRQMEDAAIDQDRKTQDAIKQFNDERAAALAAYQERRKDLITAQSQERQALAQSIRDKLELQRQSFRQELTETEQQLQALANRRRAIQERHAREDEQIRLARDKAEYNARLRALEDYKRDLQATLQRQTTGAFPMTRPSATSGRGGYQMPVFDDGGIITRPTIGMLAADGKKEAVIPLEKGQNYGLGTNINIQAPQITIGNIGEGVEAGRVRAELTAALNEFGRTIITEIEAVTGRG